MSENKIEKSTDRNSEVGIKAQIAIAINLPESKYSIDYLSALRKLINYCETQDPNKDGITSHMTSSEIQDSLKYLREKEVLMLESLEDEEEEPEEEEESDGKGLGFEAMKRF